MASKQMIFNKIYRNSFEFYELLISESHLIDECNSFLSTGKLGSLKDKIKSLTKNSDDKNKYEYCYTRLDILDEILEYSKDKYYHLKEIRDVVVLDHILNEVLDVKLYHQLLKLYYTKEILLLCNSDIGNI